MEKGKGNDDLPAKNSAMSKSLCVKKDQREKQKEKRNPAELELDSGRNGASKISVKKSKVVVNKEFEDGTEIFIKTENEVESAAISSTFKEESGESSDEEDKSKEKRFDKFSRSSRTTSSSFTSSSKNLGMQMTMTSEVGKNRNPMSFESLFPVPATKKSSALLNYPFLHQRKDAGEKKDKNQSESSGPNQGQHPESGSNSESRQVVMANARAEWSSSALATAAVAEMRRDLSNLKEMNQRQEQQVTTLTQDFTKIREEHGNEISQLKTMGTGHQDALQAQCYAIQRIDRQQLNLGHRLDVLEQAQNSNPNPRSNPEPEVVRVGPDAMGVQRKLGYLCDWCKQTYATKNYLSKTHKPKCKKNPARGQNSGS